MIQKVWLTYMVYKKTIGNGQINYATAVWFDEEKAKRMKRFCETTRDDIVEVHIQQQTVDTDADFPEIQSEGGALEISECKFTTANSASMQNAQLALELS